MDEKTDFLIKIGKEKVEFAEERLKFRKRMLKIVIGIGFVGFLFVAIPNLFFHKKINAFDCLSVSLITVSIFSSIKDYVIDCPDMQRELLNLRLDLDLLERGKEEEK